MKALALALALTGCTGAQLTAYKATALACDRAEQQIIERPASSYENDRAAIESIRVMCDAILDRIAAEVGR